MHYTLSLLFLILFLSDVHSQKEDHIWLITIGPNSVNADLLLLDGKVSIFSNPTEGPLVVTISDYIPEQANIILYDVMGREVLKQRAYYGMNNLDISHFSNGTYFYNILDKGHHMAKGKIIKIK